MKNTQKGFGLVSVILSIILVVGLFYFVVQNKMISNKDSSQNVSTSTSKYIDEIAGFSFDYPTDWKIGQNITTYSVKGNMRESYDNILSPDFTEVVHEGEYSFTELKQGGRIHVYIQEKPTAQSLKDLQDFNKLGSGGPAYVHERFIKLAGTDALLYDFTGYGTTTGYHIDMLHNNNWIGISLEYKGIDGKKVFDEITASWQFAN